MHYISTYWFIATDHSISSLRAAKEESSAFIIFAISVRHPTFKQIKLIIIVTFIEHHQKNQRCKSLSYVYLLPLATHIYLIFVVGMCPSNCPTMIILVLPLMKLQIEILKQMERQYPPLLLLSVSPNSLVEHIGQHLLSCHRQLNV